MMQNFEGNQPSDRPVSRDQQPAQSAAAEQPIVHELSTASAPSIVPLIKKEGGRVQLTREGDIAILRLGAAGENAVTFTAERMESLARAIAELRMNPPAGLIIAGAEGSKIFCAGADIKEMQNIKDAVTATKISADGQRVFASLANLPCVTVAAINGTCVGGGCELALACDYRIMTDDKRAQIGLPEIQLGILPGWGGTQRLPRLVGIEKALGIIMAGQTIRPDEALKQGLVNELAASDSLMEKALEIAQGDHIPPEAQWGIKDSLMTAENVVGRLARKMVRKVSTAVTKKKAGDNYPAPYEALDTVIQGLDRGAAHGFKLESQRLGHLLMSPESQALRRIFGLQEASKGVGKEMKGFAADMDPVIIGAGVMGAGIAAVFAKAGAHTALNDIAQPALDKGLEHVRKSIGHSKSLSDEEKEKIVSNVTLNLALPDAARGADIAIEAVVEKLPIKQKIAAQLAASMSPDAIIATNTSSLSITDIAANVPNPGRVAGMHFFNPPEIMKLVEIVRGKETSDETVQKLCALSVRLGKLPIVVQDVPGFLVNRILAPYMSETAHLIHDGYSVKAIDDAAKKFGMPMGPIRLLDEVGLDIAHHVGEVMVAGYGERMSAPPYIEKMLEAGLFGKKQGKGFYVYAEDKKPELNPELQKLLMQDTIITKDALRLIQLRLIMPIVNEAVRCLDEGVAGKDRAFAAGQIDLGSVQGFGFAPFRGGVLSYAESMGAYKLNRIMRQLQEQYGERFAPCEGIVRRAASGEGFLK